MKIAILHEMLIKLGGAEKVVEKLVNIFPDADLFTLIYDEKKVWNIFNKNKINPQVFTLKSQKIYNLTKKQRFCLPFMAISIESLDFSEYDIVLCSSSGFAHGAITKPETKLIVYYHSPARYMWDWTNEYKKDIWWNKWIKWYILNKLFLKLRQWDYIASKRVDLSLANSKNSKNRIWKYYRNKSEILYPPIEINRFKKIIIPTRPTLLKNGMKLGNYYIIISTLSEFKKIDIAINAFNEIQNTNLLIIWWWNLEWKLKNMVIWKNIKFVWLKYGDELVKLVQNSNWLIFPWEEDFWIAPIEVMSAWKPVFAYKWWWLLETVIGWETWDFFTDKYWKDFLKNFLMFDKNNKNGKYKKENCIKQAEKFWEEIFEKKIKKIVYWEDL